MTQRAPELLDMIRTLIATPSVSSADPGLDQGNRGVINHLAEWLDDLHFRIEILPLPENPGKPNLIATLGEGPAGLVFSGHTDTVPYHQEGWKTDPFQLIETDNRLYGLGTSDMKSFLALAIEAARHHRASDLQEPLILLATADEETSMAGAEELTRAGIPRARYALIGEPTGLRPVRMHKGIFMEAIHLKGHSGHSSDPSLGNSALEGMVRVLNALVAWRQELQASNTDPMFAVPVPTLNLGHIHGGDNPNRICADCELQVDLRQLPGMSIGELRAELHHRVSRALEGSGLAVRFRALFPGIPAMETAADSPIVQTVEKLTGHAAGAVAFGTEGPYLNQLGMQTVILGPGNIEQAHQPDEYLAVDRIPPCLELLGQLIGKFCVKSEG